MNKLDIKVTKLPNNLDPNTMIRKEIKKRCGSVCPYCGESRTFLETRCNGGIISGGISSWYGKLKESFFSDFRFWEKSYHYEVDSYRCTTCGCNWETPPYPINIISSEEADDYFRKLNGR